MTASYRFTVTGVDHAAVMVEAYRVATEYWGARHAYKIIEIDSDGDYFQGLDYVRATVVTSANMVVAS